MINIHNCTFKKTAAAVEQEDSQHIKDFSISLKRVVYIEKAAKEGFKSVLIDKKPQNIRHKLLK